MHVWWIVTGPSTCDGWDRFGMMTSQDLRELKELIDDSVSPVQKDIATLKTELILIKSAIDRIEIQVEKNSQSLRGNGGKGLCYEVDHLRSDFSHHVQDCNKWADVLQVVFGNPRDPTSVGLVDEVRHLKEWRESLKYWYYLMLAAVVVGVINIALRFVEISIMPTNLP